MASPTRLRSTPTPCRTTSSALRRFRCAAGGEGWQSAASFPLLILQSLRQPFSFRRSASRVQRPLWACMHIHIPCKFVFFNLAFRRRRTLLASSCHSGCRRVLLSCRGAASFEGRDRCSSAFELSQGGSASLELVENIYQEANCVQLVR